jgi:ribosomal-protein-serine acetyltransferase
MPDLSFELGGGAVLRTLQASEAQQLVTLIEANRARLSRWFAWVEQDGTDVEAQAAWIEERRADEGSFDPLGIWVGDDLAGQADLWIVDDDIGEFGTWLGETFTGRGLVTRAGQALLTAGFEDGGLHRIQARVGVENLRARALVKRMKMREEGVLRGAGKVAEGVYVDLVMCGLLVDDWRMSR